jgi:hypothetical protein
MTTIRERLSEFRRWELPEIRAEWRARLLDQRTRRMWIRNGFRRPQGLGLSTANGEFCQDCKAEPELYLVRDRLWKKAGLGSNDGLCLRCLSIRLGRSLRPRDFLYGYHRVG